MNTPRLEKLFHLLRDLRDEDEHIGEDRVAMALPPQSAVGEFVVGDELSFRARCHCTGYIFRRLADCSHDGIENHKLRPLGGFCAESAGALTLFGTALAGIPVSTTHTITGAIIGVGAIHRLSAVRWGVARRIVCAWMITIPASAAAAGLIFWIIRLAHPAA